MKMIQQQHMAMDKQEYLVFCVVKFDKVYDSMGRAVI